MTLYMGIVAVTIFLSVSLSFSPSVVAMSTSRPAGLCRTNRWTKNSAEQAGSVENYFYESLASRKSVDLAFNEEVMKPERFTEAPGHAGFESRYHESRQMVPKDVTFHTSHLSFAQVTLLLKQI